MVNQLAKKVFITTSLIYLAGLSISLAFTLIYLQLRNLIIFPVIFLIAFFVAYTMPFWFTVFTSAKPYQGKYRSKLLNFSSKMGFSLKEIYIRKSKMSNAMSMGFANTRSVLFNSNLLEKHSWQEIEGVMAHELGHHYNKDIFVYTFIIAGAISAIVLTDLAWYSFLSKQINLFYINLVNSLFALEIVLFLLRWRESLADKYAKSILKDPIGLADFLKSLKVPLKFSRYYLLFISHPWPSDRIKSLKAS